jgi:hypothetical protein
MPKDCLVEVFGLEPERRWEYLRRYYQAAAGFYDARASVLCEAEIADAISHFRERPAPRVRKRIGLREWAFTPDLEDEGLRRGFYSFARDAGHWEPVALPHSFNHVPPDPVKLDKDTYLGEYHTWYRARLPRPELHDDEVAYVHFDSVHLLGDVWVNEEVAMLGHRGPYPFRVEVTRELRRSASPEALVAVRVTYQASNQPGLLGNGLQFAYADRERPGQLAEGDWEDVGWCGLAGDVTLLLLHEVHLEDAFLVTSRLGEGTADVTCQVTVRNTTRRPFAGRLRIDVSEWLPEEMGVLHTARADVAVLPTSETVLEIPLTLANPRLWSPDSPNLYLARVVLEGPDGRELDDLVESFGVRTIGMDGPHFLLNGEPFVPRGTHDMTRYLGDSMVCPSDRSIAMDLLLHKRLGATCTRWPSDTRMHYPRIAEYCDQFGLLLSWCGFFEVWKVHPEMELYARRDVPAMVRSLRNHPSIMFWEMGDEPFMGREDFRRARWYDLVYDLVAAEDGSRPIIPAGWYANDDLVGLIERAGDAEESVAARRARVVAENPIFGRELAVWDYHYCPGAGPLGGPLHAHVDRVARALGGERPTVLTEFGLDALPEYGRVRARYGRFRWPAYAMGMGFDRAACDVSYFGRPITERDWRGTQAAQALFYETIIGRIREHPGEFAAYHLVMMTDVWTLYWGLTDVLGNPKLSYFVAQALYAPLLLSALHGNTVVSSGDLLEVTASNFGPAQREAVLDVRLRDDAGTVVREAAFGPLTVEGDISVTALGSLEMTGLGPGLYRVESQLRRGDDLLAKRLEMCYVEPPA